MGAVGSSSFVGCHDLGQPGRVDALGPLCHRRYRVVLHKHARQMRIGTSQSHEHAHEHALFTHPPLEPRASTLNPKPLTRVTCPCVSPHIYRPETFDYFENPAIPMPIAPAKI
jgi:hypothetical protein